MAELQEALKYNNHALALKLLPHLFVESSSEALYQTVVVINHAYCLSRQMLSNDTDYAERLHTASDEAQLVGAALLDTLSDGDLVQLLQSDRATEALREAVKSRAMYLVGRPRVQVYLRQIWRGRLFHQLISGKVHTPPLLSLSLSLSLSLTLTRTRTRSRSRSRTRTRTRTRSTRRCATS